MMQKETKTICPDFMTKFRDIIFIVLFIKRRVKPIHRFYVDGM